MTRFQYPENTERPRTILHEIVDRGRFSETTRKKYRLVLDQWVLFAGPNPNGWTRAHTDAFREQLIESGKSAAAISMYLAALRYVSKWYASTYAGLDFAILQPINIPSKPPVPKRYLFPDQATKLLETCLSSRPTLFDFRDLMLMIVGLETGMRVHGLSSMTFEKIGMLSKGPGGAYPSAEIRIKGRGGNKTFKVPLSPTAVMALESWRDVLGVQRGAVWRRLVRHITRKGEVIAQVIPKSISTTSIYKMIVKRSVEAQIGHVHPHILRHTFVTWREEMKIEPAFIASVTGHALKDRGALERYLNMEGLGEEGRKTTPPWFASLAKRLIHQMQEFVS